VGWGNLSANGHPSGGPWRQLHCTACDGYFLERIGFFIFRSPEVLVTQG
jgi:hypothetical protein